MADAEAGFGGNLNAFELMKDMIEAGAAGVHFEDQLSSAKKCGHMGGKVLVPTQEFEQKLAAARLAADVLGVPTLVIARTDANSAKLITSDVDPRDREFISRERTAEGFYLFNGGIEAAIARGLAFARWADMLWCETSHPDLDEARRFAEAIHAKYPGKLLAYNCSPSFNWKQRLDAGDHRPLPARAGGHGLQVPVRHPGRLPRPEPQHVRARPGLQGERHDGLLPAPGAGVRERAPGGLQRRQAPELRGHRLLRPVAQTVIPAATPPPRRSTARPRRSSSEAKAGSGARVMDTARMDDAASAVEGPRSDSIDPHRFDPHPGGPGLRGLPAARPGRGPGGPPLQRRAGRQARPRPGEPASASSDAHPGASARPPGRSPRRRRTSRDRRVEITGPVERKMMINALNSGASVFMADFEDSLSPTWANVIEGQANLTDAVRRQPRLPAAPRARSTGSNDRTATLLVRPRGWHLAERHVRSTACPSPPASSTSASTSSTTPRSSSPAAPAPTSTCRSSRATSRRGSGTRPSSMAQDALGIARGTIRATVLIETLPAAFEMDEILWELRDHAAGLNAGRWDYIFSIIRKLPHGTECCPTARRSP